MPPTPKVHTEPAAPAEPAPGGDTAPMRPEEPKPDPILDTPQLVEPAPILPGSPSPQLDSMTLFPDATMVAPEPEPGTEGFHYVLHGSLRATFDDNIFIQPKNEEEDFIFTIAPGFAVGWGDFKGEMFGVGTFRDRFDRDRSEALLESSYLYLDYIPSVTLFSDHPDENTFDHDATVEGQWVLPKLTLGVFARFQTLNLPDVDVGDRSQQQRFSAALTSKYDISGKSSIEFNLYNYIRNYQRSVDSREWRNQDWFNYQVLPKVTVGVGVAFGYVEPSRGPDQFYEQTLLRARYKATEKLTLNATIGGELRQIEDSSDRTNGVFSVGATYSPFDGTYCYLQAYSRTQTSAARAQNYTATGFEMRVRQRLFQRLYLGLGGGYQNSDYDALDGSTAPGRTDDLYFVRPSVAFDVTRWLSCEVSAEFRSNDSTNPARSFDETAAFVQFNVSF